MSERVSAGLLLQQWNQLRFAQAKGAPGNIPVLPVNNLAENGVWASVLMDGSPALLMEKSESEESTEAVRAARISATERQLVFQQRELQVVQLECRDRNLEPIFAELCLMVLEKLNAGSSVVTAITGILTELRELLGLSGTGQRARRADIGLLGEMLVLRKLVQADWRHYQAWTGPTGSRVDFRSGDVALETKTYLKKQTETVTISSLDQLEPPPQATLWLQTVVLEPDPKGDINYSALHAHIRRCLPPKLQVQFEERMDAAVELDAANEISQAYSISALRLYRVDSGFPALTRHNLIGQTLPVGVSHVRYSLDLASAQSWLTDTKVTELFGGHESERDAPA